MFIVLEPFDKRQRPCPTRPSWPICVANGRKEVKDAQVTVYGASPVPGLGVAGGFKVMIEDRGDLGLPALQKQTDDLVRKLQQKVPGMVGVTTQFRSKVPQLFMDIDRFKTASLGVSLNDVNQTLEIFLGSLYVNSFNEFGRHWQVTVQAAGEFRNRIDGCQFVPSAKQSWSDGAAGHAGATAGDQRAEQRHAVQSVSIGGDYRQHAAGLQLGRGDRQVEKSPAKRCRCA